MATPVIMPRQGQSVESCIITKWHKKPGDKVSVGDVLFSYETDKAAFDEESKVEGELLGVFFDEGDDVECLLNVCVIGNKGEDFSSFSPKTDKKDDKKAEPVPENAEKAEEKPEITAVQSQDGRLKISPRARNLAEKSNADLSFAEPTGPNGRIIERDIRRLISEGKTVSAAAKAGYEAIGEKISGTGIGGMISLEDVSSFTKKNVDISAVDLTEHEDVKLPNIRKIIAKSMHDSLATMAQLTLNTSFDATEIQRFRASVKENAEAMVLPNITINDIILYAVSRTILSFKDINAHFYDDKIVYFKHCNLGVAVDTDRGLMVPTLFGSDILSLAGISKSAKALINDCKKGSINPDLLSGGTFTVTNLGSLGVESFTPVINPPQTCILGVDSIRTQVKQVGSEYKYYPAMGLSLTFDHRAVDGAPAAKFLKALVANLENFTLLIARDGGVI